MGWRNILSMEWSDHNINLTNSNETSLCTDRQFLQATTQQGHFAPWLVDSLQVSSLNCMWTIPRYFIPFLAKLG